MSLQSREQYFTHRERWTCLLTWGLNSRDGCPWAQAVGGDKPLALRAWSANLVIWDDVANSCPFQVRPHGQASPFTVCCLTDLAPSRNCFTRENTHLLQLQLHAFRVPGSPGGLVKMLLRCLCLSGLERQALLYCLLLTKIVKFNSSPTMNCYHNTSHTGKQPFENCGRVLAAWILALSLSKEGFEKGSALAHVSHDPQISLMVSEVNLTLLVN